MSLVLVGEDYARNPGLSAFQLASFLRDIDYQPQWRARADVDADYYDSNQYDQRTLQLMEERGIPPIVVNLIAPTINLILGMEAKVRQDWIVRADDEKDADFALAMSKELQVAERGSGADRACSDAYAHQVKAGLGWVHPYRQRLNPFAFPYACEFVHRREIWWDWHADDPLLRDARWLCRRKWYDADVLTTMWPQHKALFDAICAGWNMFEDRALMDVAHPLYQDWMSQRDFHWGPDQWRNLDRKRLALYEIWYRVWRREPVLSLGDGRVLELDRQSPVHAELIRRGMAEVKISSVPKLRLSYWCGPHRLSDIPTPLPHEDIPYIPFWGYREDRTGIPYGHIRAMRPMQDEVNARRARMLWQLSARRLIGVRDVVDDTRAIEAEAARPDAALWLNGAKMGVRTIEQVLKLDDNAGLNAQQMAAYEDAKTTLQDVANTFKESLGKAGAAESGIAISQLIEQGTTALAEINENYTMARTAVGNQLYALVKADLGTKQKKVSIQKGMGTKKTVVLNEPKYDDQLQSEYRSNDVALTRARVVLDDVPASSTFRQYQFKELSNLVKGLPPELQGPLLDMVVMSTDIQNKEEIAKRIREVLGIEAHDPETMTPEEQRAYMDKQEASQMLADLKEAMALLAKERADLENRLLDAKTELTEAQTKVALANVGKVQADTTKSEVEADRLEKEPVVDPNQTIPGADPKRQPLRDIA